MEDNQPRRTRRLPASRRPATVKLRLEPLEERLALSGFGPEDGAYIVAPWSGNYSDVQIQPTDQKIVAAGSMSITNPDNTTDDRMAIARYDSLGNPDATYGSGGFSIPPLSGVSAPALGSSIEFGSDLVLQSDGKAVVSGSVPYGFAVARFNTNGTLDNSFSSDGWTNLIAGYGRPYAPAQGVGLQSTGKVVAAGLGPKNSQAEVARFTASGALDTGGGGFGAQKKGYTLTTFGGLSSLFEGLAVQPVDDKLVAVGRAIYDGSNWQLILARYTANGTLDTTFNGSGYSAFLPAGLSNAAGLAIALQSNGKIVVTGYCTGADGASDMLVVRYNPNGTLDTSFGGGSGYVRLDDGAATQSSENGRAVAIQPDGKIVVVGDTQNTSPSNVLVARFNIDGTPDATFATGGLKIGTPLPNTGYHSFGGYGVALQSDGSIIVAGYDDWDATDTYAFHPLLMRFFGSPPSPLQAAGGAAPAPTHTKPLTRAQAQPLLTEAIARWQATGENVSALGNLDVRIKDLGEATLGLASGSTIWLDDNAAGWGWFADATPGNDSEYLTPGDQGEQGRMDLLTAIAHEVGHLLGYDHSEVGVMDDTLGTGVRTLPAAATAVTEPAVVDSVLALDWTGQNHRHRDEVVESMSALFGRFNRVGLGRGAR